MLTGDTGDLQVNFYDGTASNNIINTGTRLAHPTSSSGLIVVSGSQYTNYYNGSVVSWQSGQWTSGQNNGNTWINTYNASGSLVSQQVTDTNGLVGASYTIYDNASGVQTALFGTYDSAAGGQAARVGDTYSVLFNANRTRANYAFNDITGNYGRSFLDAYNGSGVLLSESGVYDAGSLAGVGYRYSYNADGSVATYALTLTAAQASADVVALSQIPSAYTAGVSDTAANIAANIAAVNALAHLTTVTLTDSGTPSLVLSAAQLAASSATIGKISNASYNLVVSDTVADVVANLALLGSASHLASIVLIDAATSVATLSVAQITSDASLFAKISTAYKSAVVDSAANVLADSSALSSDARVSAITFTDAGTPALTLTAAQLASDAVILSRVSNPSFSITVSDPGANLTAQAGRVSSGSAAGDTWLKLFNTDGTLASYVYNDQTNAGPASYSKKYNHGVAANETATITSGAAAGNTYVAAFGPMGTFASWIETDTKNVFWWNTDSISYYGSGHQAAGVLTADTGDVQVNVYDGTASNNIINTGTRLAHPSSSSGLIVATGSQYTNYLNGAALNWQAGQWTSGQNNGDTWINTYNGSGGLVSQQVFDNNRLLGASYTLYMNASGVQIAEIGTYDTGGLSTRVGDTFSITFNANGTRASYTLNDIAGLYGSSYSDAYDVSGLLLSRSGIYDSGALAGDSFQYTYNSDGSVASYSVTGDINNNVLSGGATSATLSGGGGYDKYQFGIGSGQDRIVNGTGTGPSAQGELDFGAGVSDSQIWLVRSGNDLVLDILGTHDQATVANWFGSSPDAQLAQIKTSDGKALDSQVSQLVQAMATYSASNSGFNPTAASQAPNDPALQSAIAAAWHS